MLATRAVDELTPLQQLIVDRVGDHGDQSFANLASHPAFKDGDIALCLPGFENIILWVNITQEGADALSDLVKRQILHYRPTSYLVYLADGHSLTLPLAKRPVHYKKPHWLPVILKRGPPPLPKKRRPRSRAARQG